MLKLRIIIAAHTGNGGHRSWRVTLASIQAHFFWQKMTDDIKLFVGSCLHCLCTESGNIVPRPLGHALHAAEPNRLLHFDFCYMLNGEDGYVYCLILKDDHSGYVWLTPTKDTTAETAADTLISWFAAFCVVKQWMSDRGSNFKNELVRVLKERIHSSHHFTLAYCPWSNGTVEVVCRELLRTTRALLSENQLPHKCWSSVKPVVHSALNNSLLEHLGNRCSLTVFTAHSQDTRLSSITRKVGKKREVHSIGDIRRTQQQHIQATLNALEEMHKDVAVRSDKKRRSTVDSHNRKTNIRPINFTEGDFVLRGILRNEQSRKPSLKWLGPYRVVECRSDFIFIIEDLLTHRKKKFMAAV